MNAAVAPVTGTEGRRSVIAAVLAANYLQAAAISLPNAALLYIQGATSMADDEVGWIFTAYITASVITMTMTRWLAGRYGRKTVYLVSLVIFMIGLVLATLATTSLQFVVARIVQGGASGTLAPLSTAILLDMLPPSRHARMNQAAAVSVLVGLLSGPGIGGWLSEYYGWRSLFYVCLPVAGLIFLAMALSLAEKRAEQAVPFDFFGLATFACGMIGLQMMLDCGERLEWFDSAEVCAEAIVSIVGFYLFLVHILTARKHFLDKALFKDRNFVLSTTMYFVFGFVLLPTIALTSPMLDELLNYPADTTGYMSIPRSIALLGAMLLAARAPARIDNRLLIAGGVALVVYGNWRMLGYSPQMDWRAVIEAGVVQGIGLGLLLPVLNKVAFSTLDSAWRPEGTALFNLARSFGSTIGIAVVLTFFYDNTQAMHGALAKDLMPYRAAAHVTAALAAPQLAALNDMITGQAALIGVIGQFKVMMIAMLVTSPLALFLRRPRPANQKGA